MIINPFLTRKDPYPGQKDFDKYYISQTIHHVYKKIGDSDTYTQVDEIVEDKVDIAKEINSQVGDCGIDAYLKPYLVAGTTPPDVSVSDEVQDFSNMPEDLANAIKLGEDAQAAFKKLDPKLTGGLDLPNFLNSFTPEKFVNYVKSLAKPSKIDKPEINNENKPVESEKK